MVHSSSRRGLRLLVTGLVVALVAAMLGIGASSAGAAANGSIRGTVTSTADEFDPTDVFVTAYEFVDGDDEWVDEDEEWSAVAYAYADWRGRYQLSGLAPGSYRVEFDDEGGTTHVQYWNNQSDIEDADDVVVGSGQVVTGIDASMVEAPAIENTARPIITGSPTPSSLLTATGGTWTPPGALLYYQWTVDGREVDDANGRSFALRTEHIGKRITVEVYAFAFGHRAAWATSDPVYVRPAAPVSLTASSTASGATISWSVSPGATSYRVKIFSGSKQVGGSDDVTSTRFRQHNLDPNKSYTAEVQAVRDDSHESLPSTTRFKTRTMKRPVRIRAYQRTDRLVAIAWPAVDGASRYEISYRAAGKATKKRKLVNRGLTLRRLKPGTTYTMRVTAVASDGSARTVSKPFTFSTRKAKSKKK